MGFLAAYFESFLFEVSLCSMTQCHHMGLVELKDGCSLGKESTDVITAVVIVGQLFCKKKSSFTVVTGTHDHADSFFFPTRLPPS